MAYSYDPIFAVDPNSPSNVARNASILLFDPNDPAKTPVTLTDVTGSPVTNPITVNQHGFGPAITHPTLDRLAWEGAGMSGVFTSYEGLKEEAVAARAAAEGSAVAAAASAALVGAPVDDVVATVISGDGVARAALDAAIAEGVAVVPSQVEAQVPPLVAQAIAADGAPAAAAAAAVDAAMADKDLVIVQETFDPAEGFSFTDTNGVKTSIEVGLDGKPTARFAKDMGDAGGFPGASVVFNEGFLFTDAEGRILEDLSVDARGQFPVRTITSIGNRDRASRPVARRIRRLPATTTAILNQASNNSIKYLLNTWLPTRFPGTSPITTLGGNTENDVRHPASAAFAIAGALYAGTYDAAVVGVTTTAARTEALRVVKGVALAHVKNTTGGWGDVWQAESWAQIVEAAAWMLWESTDADTKTYVQLMAAHEADRYRNNMNPAYWTKWDGTEVMPGNSQSEDIGWVGGHMLFTAEAFPTHANAAAWRTGGLRYLLASTLSPNDVLAGEKSVHGVNLSSRFDGWNINEDGTVINHSLIHPDYMCAVPELAWSAGVLLAHNGKKIPAAAVHNGEKVYAALSEVKFGDRTIYTPNSWEIYYPTGTDWGAYRFADKAMADVLAHCLGMDSLCTIPAADWAKLHLQRCLDLQARGTTGQFYQSANEDIYAGREQWVARNLTLAVLANTIPTTSRYDYNTIAGI